MRKIFKSKVDHWIALIFLLSAILIVYVLLTSIAREEMSIANGLIFLIAGIWLPLWFFFGTYYAVDNEYLSIHCAFYKKVIPLADIVSIEPSRSWWASAALSLDRLKVTYSGERSILVSPKDKDDFIAAIKNDNID